MSLSICGCGSDEEKTGSGYNINLEQESFSIGYARIDISPACSVPMAGYGATTQRMSQNIQDYLYATSVAINDGEGGTVVF